MRLQWLLIFTTLRFVKASRPTQRTRIRDCTLESWSGIGEKICTHESCCLYNITDTAFGNMAVVVDMLSENCHIVADLDSDDYVDHLIHYQGLKVDNKEMYCDSFNVSAPEASALAVRIGFKCQWEAGRYSIAESLDSICNCANWCSDELVNETGKISCLGKNDAVYSMTQRCNGVKDCVNGFDELNCTSVLCGIHNETYLCQERSNCIYRSQLCDGTVDCLYRDDETVMCSVWSRRVILSVSVSALSCFLIIVLSLSYLKRKWDDDLRRRSRRRRERYVSPIDQVMYHFLRTCGVPPSYTQSQNDALRHEIVHRLQSNRMRSESNESNFDGAAARIFLDYDPVLRPVSFGRAPQVFDDEAEENVENDAPRPNANYDPILYSRRNLTPVASPPSYAITRSWRERFCAALRNDNVQLGTPIPFRRIEGAVGPEAASGGAAGSSSAPISRSTTITDDFLRDVAPLIESEDDDISDDSETNNLEEEEIDSQSVQLQPLADDDVETMAATSASPESFSDQRQFFRSHQHSDCDNSST